MVISRRSPEILSFYVAESARALTEFEMTKRRHDEFSDNLAAAKHLDSSPTAKNAVSFCSAAHPTPFKKDFCIASRQHLQTIFRRTEKSYRKAQHSLFLFAKIGRQPPKHRREQGGKLIRELQ
jgi:hypothetical protein